MKTEVLFNQGSNAVSFIIDLWQRDNPSISTAVTLFMDPIYDSNIILPTCSGGWRSGWQADETSGTDWYSNLKVFSPGPIVNGVVSDVVPAGDTYVPGSATSGGVYDAIANAITWSAPGSFPTTMYSFNNPVQWAAQVACTGSDIINAFSMSAAGIPVTVSNPVTLTLSSCSTPTFTNTPTITDTPTNTNSPTPTNTPTITPTPTFSNTNTFTSTPTISNTPTFTLTPTITNTPTITLTPTNTPAGLHVWPNPFSPKYAVPVNGEGVLKAYQVPPDATMTIYTVSGELVIDPRSPDAAGYIYWNGRNKNGMMVSTGTYYYVIKNGSSTLLSGKLLVLIDK
jgi:hypothetical protein